MSGRKHHHHNRGKYGNEVTSHQGPSSSTYSQDPHARRSEQKSSPSHPSADEHSATRRHESKRNKHRRSRSRSRERRRSPTRDHRHRRKSASRSPHRRSEDERGHGSRNGESSRRNQRSRSHSRSSSRERERAREKNKQDMKLQMQRNYEEQLEKMKTAAQLPNVPLAATTHASKLVEQIQQRKLLFSKKPEEPTKPATAWTKPAFAGDSDGKMSAKFKRLMGMKDETPAAATSSPVDSEALKKEQQRFEDLEKQYEIARMTTHTQRGLGLGFGSSSSIRPT